MKKSLKIIIVILAVLLLLAGIAVLIFNHYLSKLNFVSNDVMAASYDISSSADAEGIVLPKEELQTNDDIENILLLGTDYKMPNSDDPGRADCTMICSINKSTGAIKLISIERGIYVPLPEGYGYEWKRRDLMNSVYHWGGASLSQSVVRQCFNVDLAGYAQVDFESFCSVIDSIGGIDLKLTKSEAFKTDSSQFYDEKSGLYHLDGKHALKFARLRSIDSDWNRIERQRKVIIAALSKVKKLSVSELNGVIDTVLPLINTNLSKAEITALILSAPKILKNLSIDQMTVPDFNWKNDIKCDFEYESKKISNFIYDTGYEIVSPY